MGWLEDLYRPWMPQGTGKSPFVPTFNIVADVRFGNEGSSAGVTVLVNSRMYATAATAQALMEKFGASRIEVRDDPQSPLGGHIVQNGDPVEIGKLAKQRFLIFSPGCTLKNSNGIVVAVSPRQFEVNAGMLGDYYAREPEAQFPEVIMNVGWPPQPLVALSAAERDVWALLRALAGATGF